jgi:hypothetical protein
VLPLFPAMMVVIGAIVRLALRICKRSWRGVLPGLRPASRGRLSGHQQSAFFHVGSGPIDLLEVASAA